MQRQAVTNNADNDAFDDQCLFPEVDFDGFKLVVFRQERHQRPSLSVALDRHLVIEAGNDDLPAAHFGRAMHGNEIAIENARIFHTHAMNTQQVMRFRIKELRIDFVMRLDMLLGEDRAARRNPTNQRQDPSGRAANP